MQNKRIILALAVILIVGGIVVVAMASNNKKEGVREKVEAEAIMEKQEDSAMMKQKEQEAMMEKNKMMKVNNETMMENEEVMMKESSSTYVDYSADVLAQAQADQKSGRKVVLFFHAKWCPFCIAADKDFKANIGTDKFPKNVTLIKTDYDSQNELKKKYGVTTQHTFVQVDSNGTQITKWISGETSDLTKNLK